VLLLREEGMAEVNQMESKIKNSPFRLIASFLIIFLGQVLVSPTKLLRDILSTSIILLVAKTFASGKIFFGR